MLLGADGAGLALQDGDQWAYRLFDGAPQAFIAQIKTFHGRLTEGAVGRALTTGRPVYMSPHANHGGALEPFAALGVKACYVVPIRINGRVEGALGITWNTDRTRKPSPAQARLVETLAGFVGAAYYRAKLEATLRRNDHYDLLTGLPNRALLIDRLSIAQARALRHDHLLAVILLGIDHPQRTDDELGHRGGDALLAAVSDRLLGAVRSCDTVARLGGDKFAILLEDLTRLDEAESVLGRVVQTLHRPMCCHGQDVPVSANVGFTIYPFDDNPAETLLHHADQAMYEAKRAGGHDYRSYEHRLCTVRPTSAAGRIEFLFGLDRGTWTVAYNPICRPNGDTAAVEAQLFWQHPHRGPVRPEQVLGGRDHPLLARATQRLLDLTSAFLPIRDFPHVALHLNIQAADLDEPRFLERLRAWLQIARLPPARLVLEIPRSTLETHTAQARDFARAVHADGIRLLLDDLHAGGDIRLGPLMEWPFHGVKVALTTDPATVRLATSLGALAHALHLTCFAERVDDLSTRTLAADPALGLSFIQGSWIAPPIDEQRIGDWLKTQSHLAIHR